VTANNETPQIFSDDPGDDGLYGLSWRADADDAGPADAVLHDGPADAGRYGAWDPAEAGYPAAFGYGQEPEYPRGAGYAPLPPDYPDLGETGYPAGSGYPAGPGYAHEPGYPYDGWAVPDLRHGEDSGYAAEPDYAREARAVPPIAALPDSPSQQDWTAESPRRGKRQAAGSGWRRRVFRVTGGLLRPGESAAEMRHRDLINRVRTPVAGGHHRVAVLSLKGGVGKTTTAVGLGATLATLRGDRVIAVDANPDRGTLSDKVRLETAATVRDLLNERDQVRRYADVRAFTTQAPSRLEVLASDRDPAVSVAFSAEDYCDAALVLEHFYSICLTDCGTGLLHSAMSGVLRLADQIVVVSSLSVDGARSASATLDWLEAHGCGDLVRNGVVVLSAIRPMSKSTIDLDRLEHHFAARCRAVARIPYDPHLEEGAEVELELLTAETADAYLTLGALVGDGLAWPRRMTARSALP
jgi:MinD-like ATPase involved in chromosome partitioning or flagellar assembly